MSPVNPLTASPAQGTEGFAHKSPLSQRVSALDARGRKTRNAGWLVLVAAALLAASAWLAALRAHSIEPSSLLKSVHIPAEVVRSVDSSGGHERAIGRCVRAAVDKAGFEWAAVDTAGFELPPVARLPAQGTWQGRIFTVLFILLMMGMVFFGMQTRFGVVLFLPVLIGGFGLMLIANCNGGIERLADEGRYQEVESVIGSVRLADNDMLRTYVLAQTALMQIQASGLTATARQVDAVRAIAGDLAAGKALDVSAKAIYALETSALGSAVSPVAKAYEVESSDAALLWRWHSDVLATVGALAAAAGLMALGAAASMRRRAGRVMALVAQNRGEENGL